MACRPLVCNYYSTMPSTTSREPKFSHAMAAPILPLATCQIICLAFQITCILKPPPNTTFLEWPYLNKSSLMCEWWSVPPVETGKNSPFPPLALFSCWIIKSTWERLIRENHIEFCAHRNPAGESQKPWIRETFRDWKRMRNIWHSELRRR